MANLSIFTIPELPGKEFPWFTRMPLYLWRPLRQFIYQRDGGRCAYCGAAVELHACHVHHTLELSEGGTNHPTNLKTVCIPCHKSRHPHMKTTAEKFL